MNVIIRPRGRKLRAYYFLSVREMIDLLLDYLGQAYLIGTARKMSMPPQSVVAYSAEVAHCAVPIQ